MSQDQSNASGRGRKSGQSGQAQRLGSQGTPEQGWQPELVFIGALIGGALLAWFVKTTTGSTLSAKRWLPTQAPPTVHPSSSPSSPSPATRQAPVAQRPSPSAPEEPLRMPSARLGATEDQMKPLATPSEQALEKGTAGATGTAYELDPKSITGG
ncbi:MAG: hypothetical protein KF832_31395 [Caldilineaceae bacterium]|nr:hypothetical protein [Caldilineaceae bacterium]